MKKIYEIKPAHGWFKGGARETEVISVIDASISKWHILIGEEYMDESVVRKYGIFDKEKDTHQAGSVYDEQGISPTLDAMRGGYRQPMIEEEKTRLRIRKLTPKECWRLMGFDDEDFEKARQVNSDSQLYKQAGNSIIVNVLSAIFKQLYDADDIHESVSNDVMPKLVGGVGEKKSNGGRQYYQQNRIYDSEEIALCESANETFNPWYKVHERKKQ